MYQPLFKYRFLSQPNLFLALSSDYCIVSTNFIRLFETKCISISFNCTQRERGKKWAKCPIVRPSHTDLIFRLYRPKQSSISRSDFCIRLFFCINPFLSTDFLVSQTFFLALSLDYCINQFFRQFETKCVSISTNSTQRERGKKWAKCPIVRPSHTDLIFRLYRPKQSSISRSDFCIRRLYQPFLSTDF